MNRAPIDPTDCAAARAQVDAYVLNDLTEAEARLLAAHVRGCPECEAQLHDSMRLLTALGSLPAPIATSDLDERIILAAIEDRVSRGEHRFWFSDLWLQVLRGAMRTTGTLMVTVVTVALLGGAFVFAATNFFSLDIARNTTPSATVSPDVTPTVEPPPRRTPEPTAPTEATPAVKGVSPTAPPAATAATTPGPTSAPTPIPTGSPVPSTEPTPVVTPGVTPVPTQSPQPTPSATEKPRRTPPPGSSPSASPASSSDASTSP